MFLAVILACAAGSAQAQTSVSGTVSLQWVAAGSLAQPMTFTFQTTDAATTFAQSLTTNPDGTFTLTGIPAGNYNLFIKGSKWLQKSVPVNTTAGSVTGVNVSLLGGDATGDNKVNALDFLALRAAYGSAVGDGRYAPAADFNCDGKVNALDFLILRSNYGMSGDVPTPPASLSSLTIMPSTVVGGHSATAIVALSSAAPQGGATVSLSTSDTTVIGIPPTVAVAQGQLSASFKVNTIGVTTTASPSITASYNASYVATLNVTPPATPNTYAYVANTGSATISVVDLATSNLIASIPVSAGPSALAVSPNAATVYVSCSSANSVNVIDTGTNSVISTVAVGANPEGIAVSPDGRRIVVVNSGAGTVSVIDGTTNSVIATVTVGAQPSGITYNQDGRFIYVTSAAGNSVSVLDALTDTVITTIPVGNAPMGITALPESSLVYVANSGSNSISVIDPETQTVVQTIPVASGPTNLAGVADGTELYVTCPAGNTISVVDAVNGVLSQNLSVASQPTGVAVDGTGTLFVVTTQANAQVLVKDVDTNGTSLSAATGVGNQPAAVAIATEGVPTPYLTQPSGSIIGGQLTISPNVSDATTDDPTMNYELYVDGVLASSSDIYSPNLYWDTETVANGPHTLVLRAVTEYNTIGLSQPLTITTSNVINNVALSLSTFDPEPPSNQLETVTGSVSGGGNWTVQVQDSSGNTMASSSGSGTTFSATWDGINQTTSAYADEGPYSFVVNAAGTTSGGKTFAKSKKAGTSPPLVIVNGVPGWPEATQRAQLVITNAKATGTPYKYLIKPDFPVLAKFLKDPNCRYLYFNGHGGTWVNSHNPADGSMLDGIVNGTSAGYSDDPETVISLGGKGLEVHSHTAYWDVPYRLLRGKTPHIFPTIASLGLRYLDKFRFVYLDGCETGLANDDGTHGTTKGFNDMYDYFGLNNAPPEDDGFYFGWKVTVFPQTDPYSFFYWNTRYFNRVGGGLSFYTAFSQTLSFSPVDQNIKDATFGEGSGVATMHP